MSELRERLRQLREEYFTELSDSDLIEIHNQLNDSNTLIIKMREYSDQHNKRGVPNPVEERMDAIVNEICAGDKYSYDEMNYLYDQLGELKNRGHF